MRLYFYGTIMLLKRFLGRKSTGQAICWFASKMGVVYIKMAQILAMQSYGTIFTEADRLALSEICDACNPISYKKIEARLRQELGDKFDTEIASIDPEPLGSASISQVHRAVLKNGEAVAIKVKRDDVTRKIDRDVKQIRRLVHRFGRFAGLRNMLGGDQALDLWAQYIYQEIDFIHERQNLERYQAFAESVNDKVKDMVKIKTPRVYPELCTKNIIVMEFISAPTINQMELNQASKHLISHALNSYISLSFYALLNDLPLVFHGDPHGGNIYIDEAGNIGFLDMGLIFEFTPEEAAMIKEMFFLGYTGKSDRLVDLLIKMSKHTAYDHDRFETEIRAKVEMFQTIPVTQFFIEMITVFTKYNMSPPIILFKAAKAFLALFGINNFIENHTSTRELLSKQIIDAYARHMHDDWQKLVHSGLRLVPNCLRAGLRGGVPAQAQYLSDFNREVIHNLENLNETLDLLTPLSQHHI